MCEENGRSTAFLCPNGTIFNQQYFVCDWWILKNFTCGWIVSAWSGGTTLTARRNRTSSAWTSSSTKDRRRVSCISLAPPCVVICLLKWLPQKMQSQFRYISLTFLQWVCEHIIFLPKSSSPIWRPAMQLSLLYRWLAEAGLLLGKEPAPGILRTINGYGRIWFPSSAVFWHCTIAAFSKVLELNMLHTAHLTDRCNWETTSPWKADHFSATRVCPRKDINASQKLLFSSCMAFGKGSFSLLVYIFVGI